MSRCVVGVCVVLLACFLLSGCGAAFGLGGSRPSSTTSMVNPPWSQQAHLNDQVYNHYRSSK